MNAQDESIANSAIPSTVSLIMEDDFEMASVAGNEFVVGDGLVATSIHVVEGAQFGHALSPNSSEKHKIEGYYSIDTDNHLVILSIPTLKAEALKASYYDNPDIGTKITAIGNKRGISDGVSSGIVTGVREFGERKLFQISAPISKASIGGPVLDEKGEVIGVALSALYAGTQINLAVPVQYLRELSNQKVEAVSYLPIQKGIAKNYLPESEQKYILKGLEVFN